MSSEDRGKPSPKRDRYWSVMLVGDHGRVIPFRHFKGLAIGLCAGFILMMIAIVVMAILYTHQMKKLAVLQTRMSEVQQQNSKLRDEKDLYLTRLMLKENKPVATPVTPAPTVTAKGSIEDPPVVKEAPEASKPPVSKPEKPAPVKKKPVKMKWMADIRKFSVSYDAKQETLKAQFRIYNTSRPKKPLSGRSVIVFKGSDNAPTKWLSVPQVQLNDGKPPATKGQPFQIRNYFTMRFRAYRQKPPIPYTSVTAYVFSEEGQLLASKDLAVNIKVPLPEKREPPKPAPVVEKTPQPPVREPMESTVDTPKDASPPTAAPAGENSSTGTGPALPNADTVPTDSQPTIEKENAPASPAPKAPAGEAPVDSSPTDTPAGGAEKESLTPPKPTETGPKP